MTVDQKASVNSDIFTSRKKSIPSYLQVLPFYRKIFYGCGGPPLQTTSNAMGFFLPIFLLEVAAASPLTLSIVQIISRIYDAITDPIVGYLVNKSNSRFGKYIPWIFLATPVYCIAFIMLFSVPEGLNEKEKIAYYTLSAVLLQTGLTCYHVPYSSMCMVLSSNPIDRDSLVSTRMFFEIAGVLVGAGLFGGLATMHRVNNMDHSVNITSQMYAQERTDYTIASLSIVIFCIVCAMFVVFGSREKESVNDSDEPYFKSLRKVMCYKPYLLLMFAFMFTSLGVQLIQSNLALYLTHSLKQPKATNLGILILLVCALAQVPFGNFLIKKFSKKNVYFSGLILAFPSLISLAFLPSGFPIYGIYLLLVSVSYSIMVAMVLPWSMLPDVIDMFFLANGFRLEAAFYSFYVFFNKFAVGFSLGLSAIVLLLSGYQTGQKPGQQRTQPESVGLVLRYYIGTSGIFCFIISMIFLYFYPITNEIRAETCKKLEQIKDDLRSNGKLSICSINVLDNFFPDQFIEEDENIKENGKVSDSFEESDLMKDVIEEKVHPVTEVKGANINNGIIYTAISNYDKDINNNNRSSSEDQLLVSDINTTLISSSTSSSTSTYDSTTNILKS